MKTKGRSTKTPLPSDKETRRGGDICNTKGLSVNLGSHHPPLPIQLTFQQHRFQLPGSRYTWNFFNTYIIEPSTCLLFLMISLLPFSLYSMLP